MQMSLSELLALFKQANVYRVKVEGHNSEQPECQVQHTRNSPMNTLRN